jgi:hypothetical protein
MYRPLKLSPGWRKNLKVNINIAAVISCILFIVFSYLNVLRLGTVKTAWNVDEAHMVYETAKPVFSAVNAPHVFGGARWALRLSYPFSVLYMTSHMGGEHHITGWDYPGHFYILNHMRPDSDAIAKDPNLQDFIFFQRLIFIELFIASLAFIFYALFRALSGWAAGIYILGLWISPIIEAQLYYAYADIFMASVANSIFGILLLSAATKVRHIKALVFLSALAVSSKINGFFLTIPVASYLYSIREDIGRSWQRLLLIFIGSWFFLNTYELIKPDAFLHYIFANIYHYKTGHWVTEPSGLFQLKKALHAMPYFLGIATISIILFVASQWKKKNFLILNLSIIFLAALYLLSLSSLHFFYERNYTILILLLSLFAAISIGGFIADAIKVKWLGALFAISLVIYISQEQFNVISTRSTQIIQDSLKNCSNIGVIGKVEMPQSVQFKKIPSIPREYIFIKEMSQFVDRANGYDCVLARWSEEDKTYTNYLLPQMYRLKARSQDLFIYESWRK